MGGKVKVDTYEIGGLLSVQQSYIWDQEKAVLGPEGSPLAKKTLGGWVLYGGTKNPDPVINLMDIQLSLEDQLHLHMNHEFLFKAGTPYDFLKVHSSIEDEWALKQVSDNLRFDETVGVCRPFAIQVW